MLQMCFVQFVTIWNKFFSMSSQTEQATCSDAISFPGFTSSVDYFRRRKGWSARAKGDWGERREARTWQEKTTTYFREKQNAGMGPTSGTVGVLEEKRTGNERKERDDEREKTQVPAESRDITLAMPSQHRDVLQPRRRTCARFIGQRAENLCGDSHWQVVLLAMKNRNFSLTLVYLRSSSPLFPLSLSLFLHATRMDRKKLEERARSC